MYQTFVKALILKLDWHILRVQHKNPLYQNCPALKIISRRKNCPCVDRQSLRLEFVLNIYSVRSKNGRIAIFSVSDLRLRKNNCCPTLFRSILIILISRRLILPVLGTEHRLVPKILLTKCLGWDLQLIVKVNS